MSLKKVKLSNDQKWVTQKEISFSKPWRESLNNCYKTVQFHFNKDAYSSHKTPTNLNVLGEIHILINSIDLHFLD